MRFPIGATVLLALPALVFPGRARACDPVTTSPHKIDPAAVGVDQTPPELAQPAVSDVHAIDHSDQGCGPRCGWDNTFTLSNLATDDMTPVGRIGYRLTTVAGTAPKESEWRDGDVIVGASSDGKLTLFWDGDLDVDFTLQVVAVDDAGNESAPQTARVQHANTACSIGGRGRAGLTPLVVALALAAAAARRRR
jgi:hypothetical protein